MMLYGIAHRVEAALKARGIPFPVVYGPERTDTTTLGTRTRIVIERDREGGDSVGPARSVHTNPNMRAVRAVGAVARVFAKSERAGAGVQDHEGVADKLVDRLHVALDSIIRSDQTLWAVSSAKLLNANELEQRGLKTWPGVVYEIKFSVDRGVFDTDWTGEAAPEAELGADSISSTTTVKLNGVGGGETACGG